VKLLDHQALKALQQLECADDEHIRTYANFIAVALMKYTKFGSHDEPAAGAGPAAASSSSSSMQWYPQQHELQHQPQHQPQHQQRQQPPKPRPPPMATPTARPRQTPPLAYNYRRQRGEE